MMVAMATASLLCAGSAHADQLLGTFEGNMTSSLPSGSSFGLSGPTATLNPAPTYTALGATNGATALRLRIPLNYQFGVVLTEGSDQTALKNAWNSHDRLLFDVTVPQINTANGVPDTDGYVVFQGAINSDGTGGGFKQTPGNFQIVSGGSGDNAYNAGTVTFAWNYRAENILFPADAPSTVAPFGFTQFNFSTNSGNLDTAPFIHLDNFRFVLVPEPMTLGALTLAGALAARRRR